MARRSPTLSHLFFADDSLFFLLAEVRICVVLIKIFEDYCRATGQQVNFEKSSLFFSHNTKLKVKEEICSMLNIPEDNNPGKYLCLPTIWGRSKQQSLSFVKEKVMTKVKGWKQHTLNSAEK